MPDKIFINGEAHPLEAAINVEHLISWLGLDQRKIAVERNEAIVPRSRYDQTWLVAGDRLEIVHFIGGG